MRKKMEWAGRASKEKENTGGKRKCNWVERKENDPKERNFGPKENPEFKMISEFQKLD